MRHRSTLPPTEELKRLYLITPSLEKIGEQFGCSGGTIRNRLLGAGFKLRPRGGIKGQPSGRKLALPEEAWEQIIHEYAVQEISGETIAKERNVSPGVIYRGLEKRGIELRERTAHMKDLWAERSAQRQFARQFPRDWFDKPFDWRIIGDPLLQRPMSNLELTEQLLRGKLVDLADYGKTAREISRNRAFVKRVNEIRNWLGRPGEVRGEVTK